MYLNLNANTPKKLHLYVLSKSTMPNKIKRWLQRCFSIKRVKLLKYKKETLIIPFSSRDRGPP